MSKNTEIPPFRYIDQKEILWCFKKIRDTLEPEIRRMYHKNLISKNVAIDRQQLIVVSEKLMLAIHDARMDPKDVIEWIQAIGTSSEAVEQLNNKKGSTRQPHLATITN